MTAWSTRRSFLAASAAMPVAVALASVDGAGPARPLPPTDGPVLRDRAAGKGLDFGLAVAKEDMLDPRARTLLLREAAIIVPENALKWQMLEPVEGQPDYRAADAISRFAEHDGLRLRGHAGFWYRRIPDWAARSLNGPGGAAAIMDHIAAVVRRYRGRIAEWDVVNEAIEPLDGQPAGLRLAPFDRPRDAAWIADAFAAAAQADPQARLFYNDYGLEWDTAQGAARRSATLALLAELRRRRAPIHGLGIQSHLKLGARYDQAMFRRFLADVDAHDIAIRITELDVNDMDASRRADIAAGQVVDLVRQHLDAAFDERATVGLLCWGVFSQRSWMRSDPTRRNVRVPLAFDRATGRTSVWSGIAQAFDHASARDRPGQAPHDRGVPDRQGRWG